MGNTINSIKFPIPYEFDRFIPLANWLIDAKVSSNAIYVELFFCSFIVFFFYLFLLVYLTYSPSQLSILSSFK